MAEEQIIPSAAEPAPVEQPAADKAPVQATKEERTPARVKFVSDVNELPRDDEYASEEYEQLISKYESSFAVKEGEIVKGKVLRIENDEVIVDIGFKSEGSIKLAEFTDPSEAQVGNEIEVFVEEIEDQEGKVVVSKQKADF
ncbi:MAG TPA: S1 RNA-binding domain-containing protein, partial [Candidatus Latescibacteria bacterium]|nr:S1 RNA-binding domain-containing protein [Candidatus Latescibacterota bacterium]